MFVLVFVTYPLICFISFVFSCWRLEAGGGGAGVRVVVSPFAVSWEAGFTSLGVCVTSVWCYNLILLFW